MGDANHELCTSTSSTLPNVVEGSFLTSDGVLKILGGLLGVTLCRDQCH